MIVVLFQTFSPFLSYYIFNNAKFGRTFGAGLASYEILHFVGKGYFKNKLECLF